ncbi:DUF4249 domain-containing protein [Maribacter algarum]|uniref:DUF4249 domain-containing protein n=1 Tax=Maribacter algarum (ex Zhang et al. 2020) TaxID=2578118 RepID=A0A5S3PQW7_9FLAO|nr:DUF4249 domain-containing protein [Maribacter algarum]TMM57102.1 DUF4249 domain-containing protein [Maribacter algarum]
MKLIFCIISFFSFLQGCIEPFEAETQDFENVLVVDARLTNEEKRHEIVLSRSYRLEEGVTVPESNASVQIMDETGNTYRYIEETPGLYKSVSAFAAQPNVGYELLITSKDGKSYKSETAVRPTKIEIKEVKAEIEFDDLGKEGLQITLVNENPNAEAKFFRYEFEETYKIIAPYYNPFEFEVADSLYFAQGDFDSYEINIIARTEEARTCYTTNASTDINLSDSERNMDGQSGKTIVRFLRSDDFAISHRYSILVKQFAITSDTHGYYSSLESFSSSQNVFSNVQTGFLSGNIAALDSDELVLGYFEVASLSTERYFLNFTDFFPEKTLPPFPINCETTQAPPLVSFNPHLDGGFVVDEVGPESPLLTGILSGTIAYHAINEEYEEQPENLVQPIAGEAPYLVKSTECIDCRALGSNIKPEFWIE